MVTLKSRLGRANWKGVWGWALDASSPETKVVVEIVIDGEVMGRVVADDPRPQLKHLMPEHRDCGFQFLFPNGLSALSRHVIHARCAEDGTELEDSPMIVEPAPGFDPALEQTLGNALQVAASAAQTPTELDAPLRFVVDQIARLMATRRELAGGDTSSLAPELAGLTERWAGVLNEASGPGAALPDPAAIGAVRRMLVIGDEVRVLDDSARALLAQMASLLRLGAVVEFVASEYQQDAVAHVAAVERLGASYLRPPLSLSVEDVLRRNRGLYETILIHRVTNFEKYAALARSYCPLARVVFSVDSLFFVRMLRRAALQNWAVGTEKGQALRLREMMGAWESHVVVTHSAFEAALLRQGVNQVNVHVVGWPAEPRPRTMAFSERGGLGFVGDFEQHADLDAAAWLIEVLMPAVWRLDPAIRCVVAGCNMPEALRTLSRDGVEIVEQKPGSAPDDNPILDHLRLTVMPHRASAGLPPAVIASLAAGLPCVGSPASMEALSLPDDLRQCVTTSVDEMAALAHRLHEDEAENARLADAGLRFITEHFSAAAVDAQMQAVVGVTAAGGETAAAAPAAEMAAAD